MIQIPIVSKPQLRLQRLIYIFKRHRWELMAMGMMLLIYLFIFSQMPTSVFWSPDEGAKFIQLHTLHWEGELRYLVPYPGHRLDPAYIFYPHPLDPSHIFYAQSILYPTPLTNGDVHFNWPIWFPLISSLPFHLFGARGLYLIPLVSGLLTVAVSGWLAYRLLPPTALLTIITVGLATPIFFYSLLFWEHTLVILMGLAALGAVSSVSKGKWLALTLSGLFLVGAVVLRVEMLLYGLALLLAGALAWFIHYRQQFIQINFKRWDKLLIAGGIGIALVAFCSLFNLVQPDWSGQKEKEFIEQGFSRLKEPQLLRSLPYRLQEIWINTPLELGPELPASLGWLGLAGVAIGGQAIVWRGRTGLWLVIVGTALVAMGSAYALFLPYRYRAIHSLLLPAPHLVLAFLFPAYARQLHRFEVTLLAVTTILYLVVGPIIAIFGVRGGLEWGARYLLIAYPLASICAVIGLYHFYRTCISQWEKRVLLAVAALLLLIGIQYEVRGVWEIQTTKKDLIAYYSVLEASQEPVVTDLYWLPAALSTRFIKQEIYTLAQREELYKWLNLAGDQVNSFLFVSFAPLEANFIQQAPYPLILRRERVVHGIDFAEFEVLRTEN